MTKNRMEAFSDGVLAIVLTIMVLELKVPHGAQWESLAPLLPIFLSYVLSFVYVGIYWNNHHHMMHLCHKVSGPILWANMNLLFWLSLIPFTTGWLGENHFEKIPTFLYGLNLLAAAFSYFILQNVIIASQGEDSMLKKAVQKDVKGKLSLIIYLIGIAVSNFNEYVGMASFTIVALIWLVPDSRIESLQGKE